MEFDRKVGDTAAGIDLIGGCDRLGRADVDTGDAATAVIGLRRIYWQRQIGEKFTQKKPATILSVDEVGVLADPTQSCFVCKGFLQYRCGIDKGTIKSALTIDDTLLSRMLSVAETVPAPVLDALGAAKGVGRDRWEDLKKIVQVPAKSAQALELVQSDAFSALEEGTRFGFLVEKLKVSGTRKAK